MTNAKQIFAPESALKLQNNTYHKNDETTPGRDMIIDAPRDMQQLSESSLSKGPEMDKYEDLKHANHSDLTIPDSSENKEENFCLNVQKRILKIQVQCVRNWSKEILFLP